jgi:hypothetical protein
VSQQPGPFNLGQSMNEALALHRQGRLRALSTFLHNYKNLVLPVAQ